MKACPRPLRVPVLRCEVQVENPSSKIFATGSLSTWAVSDFAVFRMYLMSWGRGLCWIWHYLHVRNELFLCDDTQIET